MTNGSDQNPSSNDRPFDLEERSARFGEAVIDLCKKVPLGPLTNRLVDQLIGASSSIGANYVEADDAVSKKDFRHKISISKREARESKHFLRLIARAVPEIRDEARVLWQEAKELHLIFAAIYRRK
jgi:four helix bundle protein